MDILLLVWQLGCWTLWNLLLCLTKRVTVENSEGQCGHSNFLPHLPPLGPGSTEIKKNHVSALLTQICKKVKYHDQVGELCDTCHSLCVHPKDSLLQTMTGTLRNKISYWCNLRSQFISYTISEDTHDSLYLSFLLAFCPVYPSWGLSVTLHGKGLIAEP